MKKNEIRDILKTILDSRDDHAPFSDKEFLLQTGRLDSMNILEIVTVLEEKYGADFSALPFDAIRLSSVDSILELLGTAALAA